MPEGTDDKPYYFPDDITDKSIEWLHRVRAQDPVKPWFMFYSTGCAHAPHHVPKEWADKYKGTFDDGWDKLRERTFERQKQRGIVPQDAELTERPDAFPAWDTLDDAAKQLYTRQAEVYAGFQENADWNVGRLLDAVDEMGDLDNTLVIYIWGDNGASLEGTITGSFNELTFLNGLVLDPDQQLKLIEEYGGLEALGGDHTAPHIAAAWAHAFNTPFQWGKQSASHLGGTRDPMVVSWPSRIKPDASPRAQFTHVIDVGPTILEAAGIPEPKTVDGIAQEPMDGTSFLYSFEDATTPERHTQQYFEMFASRAMYKDGWWAASRPDRLPWDLTPKTLARFGPEADWDADRDVGWELYDLTTDFSQADDVGAAPRQGQGAAGAVVEGGRTEPGLAPHGRPLGDVRHPAAPPDADPIHLCRRRGQHPVGHGPADLRPLVLDRGRPCGAGRRGRGGDRGDGRLHRRICPLGGRPGQPVPHLLAPRRRDVQAGVQQTHPGRRGDGPDAVRGGRAQARDRRPRVVVHQR